MVDHPNFSDTRLPVRDRFIVSGDYVVDAAKVVAVSSVYPCAETMMYRFTVLVLGSHEVYLAAEPKVKPGTLDIDRDKMESDTKRMREDFLCQWRNLTRRD